MIAFVLYILGCFLGWRFWSFMNVDSFHYDSFSENLAKYVRAGFVPNGEEHWKNKKVIPNKLCNS